MQYVKRLFQVTTVKLSPFGLILSATIDTVNFPISEINMIIYIKRIVYFDRKHLLVSSNMII